MAHRIRLVALLALLAAAPQDAGAEAAPGGEGTETSAEPAVPWTEVAGSPERFLGKTVHLVVQFHSLEERWNPYVTRFGPYEYFAVEAWTDEQRPWIEAEYDDPAVHLYVRRSERIAGLFRALEIHERVAVTGVVRELFAGRPWVEVVAAEKLAEYFPEGSVLHAIRAIEMMDEGLFGLAADEMGRVLEAPVPEHVRVAFEAERDRCRAEQEAKDSRRIPAPGSERKPLGGAPKGD